MNYWVTRSTYDASHARHRVEWILKQFPSFSILNEDIISEHCNILGVIGWRCFMSSVMFRHVGKTGYLVM
ncbi:hypothetical protein CsSME_00038456 [Camellia sinensis var. sinensis]